MSSPSSNQYSESNRDIYGLLGLPSTNFSKNLDFKIGDRAKLGDDIFTIDKIEDDFIGGTSDDGCYIGGSIDCCQFVSIDDICSDKTTETIPEATEEDGY